MGISYRNIISQFLNINFLPFVGKRDKPNKFQLLQQLVYWFTIFGNRKPTITGLCPVVSFNSTNSHHTKESSILSHCQNLLSSSDGIVPSSQKHLLLFKNTNKLNFNI